MRPSRLLACTIFLSTGCAHRYKMEGLVLGTEPSRPGFLVSHKAIAGVMPAMAMPVRVRNAKDLDGMAPGSRVRFTLVTGPQQSYARNIRIEKSPSVIKDGGDTIVLTTPKNKVALGQPVPDFTLTDQQTRAVRLDDLRGRVVAVNFIYTRCPLPNYCPLMSQHFSDLAMNLQKNAEMKDKVRLLSITFDPKNDTPAVLKTYGTGYYNKDVKPDFTLWQLATGSEEDIRKIADFIGLTYQTDANDKTQIIHSLRTVVIDPQGKVRKVFAGNEWTNDQLLKELEASLTTETK